MFDILHRVGIGAPPVEVYNALATREGLSNWWTNDTRGDTHVGGVVHFQFGEKGFFDMKVLELSPGQRVVWQVIDGPDVWIGTRVIWDLKAEDDDTVVLFRHEGWKEPVEFMHHCSTKWATFLMSLKSLIETGEAAPWPNDIHIGTNGD